MGTTQDIRWRQRFANYRKALGQLRKFIDKGQLSELERQGLIKAFEYTYELAWNTLRDFLEHQGIADLVGSRDVFRQAFMRGIITSGDEWMDMIGSRNRTAHTYNEETAAEIAHAIVTIYYPLFSQLEEVLSARENLPE